MKSIKKIGILIIINVIFSQISTTFIFSFIESLFLELVEEFFIKILPDYFFSNELYYNRSFALRIRDISVYDSSQTNITIWTSIIGAFIYYYINNKIENQNNKEQKNVNLSDLLILLLFYVISVISLIFLIFLPYEETNKTFSLKEISNQSINLKKIIPYFLILISLSISIGNYNMHSIQYLTYYYKAYKGILMPLFIGFACIIKFFIIKLICNIWGEDNKEYQSNKNYKFFILIIISIIFFCFIISIIFTYLIEKEINILNEQNKEEELRDLIIKIKPKNLINDIYKLYCNNKYKELYYFLLINLLSKFEKIEWKNNINLNLYLLNFKFKRYINLIFIVLSILIGIFHDKKDFYGFKLFLNMGNVINIISCLIYIIFYNFITNKIGYTLLISYINLFFVGNYYVIMLPELIRKYGTKYILEISGFIALTNIFSRLFEIFFIINKLNKKLEFSLLIIQIISSLSNIFLILRNKITRKQIQLDLQQLEEENKNNTNVLTISALGIQNKIDETI